MDKFTKGNLGDGRVADAASSEVGKRGQRRAMCCVAEVKQDLSCTREGKLCLQTAKVKITPPAPASLVYRILFTLTCHRLLVYSPMLSSYWGS